MILLQQIKQAHTTSNLNKDKSILNTTDNNTNS